MFPVAPQEMLRRCSRSIGATALGRPSGLSILHELVEDALARINYPKSSFVAVLGSIGDKPKSNKELIPFIRIQQNSKIMSATKRLCKVGV